MSTPYQGRVPSFPIIWDRSRARSVSVPETPVARCPSDEELMARLHANDSNVLNLLFERYSRLVLGIALRILHDHGEAEEVVQESFFQVFQKANLFDPTKGAAKAWIVQIAFHRALDRKSYLDRRGFYLGTDIGSLDDVLLSKTDLDQEIGARFNRMHLEKAFEELPEKQRRTLELFYFEGLELREIIEKLNEPLGNVRHHLYRGLERLRNSAFIQRIREK
jgi:RNA polymerase sigma-70 factor (ECF subfamily)